MALPRNFRTALGDGLLVFLLENVGGFQLLSSPPPLPLLLPNAIGATGREEDERRAAVERRAEFVLEQAIASDEDGIDPEAVAALYIDAAEALFEVCPSCC